MTTFREYVLSFKPPKPRLPHPDWVEKQIIVIVSIVFLAVYGIPYPSRWLMLLWVGIIPLGFYLNYCTKKENGELK